MHILLSLVLNAAAFAEVKPSEKFDWNCESGLAPVARGGTEVYADQIELPSGQQIFTRIEKPIGGEPKRWILALHGFLDSHRAFDLLTPELIARGYGVIRPDLPGFARSLRPHHHGGSKLDYRESVQAVEELITTLRLRFQISSPRLIGHSRGAGLALAVLARPGVAEHVDDRHVIVAPYVYPNDAYVAKKMHLSSLTTLAAWTPTVLKIFPQFLVDSLVDPQLRSAFASYLRRARQSEGLDFNDYRVRRAVEDQVDVALGIVKGMRHLNSLNELFNIPQTTHVDMIYGDRDDIVEPPLARELARDVRRRGGRAVEIRAGHHIPITDVAALLEVIID